MINPYLFDICGPGQPILARTTDGSLVRDNGRGWQSFDFNALYQGEYPVCTWTALAWVNEEFYLAGIDAQGNPHLFTSLLGSVWEQRTLTAHHPLFGSQRVTGRIVRILHEPQERQVFLICSSGQLVTLADCPKCLRIQQVSTDGLRDGRLENGMIVLVRNEDGSEILIRPQDAAQHRVAWDFAQPFLADGQGLVVDLRSPDEFTASHLPGSQQVSLTELSDWLTDQPRKKALFFVCRAGVQADDAVRLARKRGFSKAWSLGGLRFMSERQSYM